MHAFSLAVGIIIYGSYLKKYECRSLLYLSVGFSMIGETISLLQILRYNIKAGIPDFVVLAIDKCIFFPLAGICSGLPLIILLQKMIPTYVESTIMSFIGSLRSLVFGVCGSLIGIFINWAFVGVTSNNLKNMYVLSIINLAYHIYLLIIIKIIPYSEDVEDYMINKS